jgi:hypothetical protein
VDLTPSGGILTLASNPSANSAGGTTISVASIVPDGPDITSSLKLMGPSSVVSGTPGKANLTITNSGSLALSGSIPVALYLSQDTAVSPDDRALPAIHVSAKNIAPGKSKTVAVGFAFPKNLPDGQYFLLADLNANGAIAEINTANDQSATRSAIKVAQAFTDVAVKFVAQPPGTITAGKAAPITLLLTNNGNIAANGNAIAQLLASSDQLLDSSDVPLAPGKNISIHLKPHASEKVTLTLLLKASALPPGTEFLVATIGFAGRTHSAFSNSPIHFS